MHKLQLQSWLYFFIQHFANFKINIIMQLALNFIDSPQICNLGRHI